VYGDQWGALQRPVLVSSVEVNPPNPTGLRAGRDVRVAFHGNRDPGPITGTHVPTIFLQWGSRLKKSNLWVQMLTDPETIPGIREFSANETAVQWPGFYRLTGYALVTADRKASPITTIWPEADFSGF